MCALRAVPVSDADVVMVDEVVAVEEVVAGYHFQNQVLPLSATT